MQFLYEKVAYLKGLAEGLEIDSRTKEGKLLIAIIDTLSEFADAVTFLTEGNEAYELEQETKEFNALNCYADDEISGVGCVCPNCGKSIEIKETMETTLEQRKIVCPECLEPIIFIQEKL